MLEGGGGDEEDWEDEKEEVGGQVKVGGRGEMEAEESGGRKDIELEGGFVFFSFSIFV